MGFRPAERQGDRGRWDCDIAHAVNNGVSIIRADVAGQAGELMSYGSSGIVNRTGTVLTSARILDTGLIVADVADFTTPLLEFST